MNRGGNRGQGHGQSVKRKPNTPVGGAYKDQRRGLNSDEMDYDDEEEEWTEVSYNRRSPQRQQRNQPQTDQQNQQVRSEQQQHQQHQQQQQQPTNANPDANQTIDSTQGRLQVLQPNRPAPHSKIGEIARPQLTSTRRRSLKENLSPLPQSAQ